jgi:asparagine synthase (glutamine-hydrolysing)
MATDDVQLRITFNGEIYNYRALRKELEAKGVRFHSESDTEVLLHLYADRGMDMVHALRGMYAFGIWDERKKGLLLARDPFGIKPLYYTNDGATLRFASQVKALAAGGGVNLTSDPAGMQAFTYGATSRAAHHTAKCRHCRPVPRCGRIMVAAMKSSAACRLQIAAAVARCQG